MQVRASRPSTCANFSNFLTSLDQIAFLDPHFGSMGIPCDEVVAMVNFNHLAIFWVKLLGDHDTARGSQNGR